MQRAWPTPVDPWFASTGRFKNGFSWFVSTLKPKYVVTELALLASTTSGQGPVCRAVAGSEA